MNTLYSKIASLGIAVLLIWPSTAKGHEFDRGHIERSVDIVVRNHSVQVKYAIGLSDETIVDWLSREELIESDAEQRYRALILKYEQENGSEEEQEKQAALESGENPKGASALSGEATDPAEFQTELQDLLQEKLGEKICANMELLCNGQEIEISEPQYAKSSRHHVSLEITLKSTIPDVDVAEFVFNDKNFLDVDPKPAKSKAGSGNITSDSELAEKSTSKQGQNADDFLYSGNIRTACRVKGGAVMVNSNVAPVLARAKVADVGQLDAQQRVEAASISAKIVFAQTEKSQSRLSHPGH